MSIGMGSLCQKTLSLLQKRKVSKCIKLFLFKRSLYILMKSENNKVREYCEKIDWENTAKWLHFSKSTFKAVRKIQKLKHK